MFKNLEVQMLSIENLIMSQDYNRAINEEWCRARAKEGIFNRDLIQPIHVSLRDDGKYYILDGRHRTTMLIKMGIEEVMCVIHVGLSYIEEALLFKKLNEEFRKVSAWQGFKALIEAKDDTALDINNILSEFGFYLTPNDKIINIQDKEFGKIRSVKVIEKLYNNLGRNAFSKIFDIISKTWCGQPSSLKRDIISGVATFLKGYEDEVSDKDMISKWKTHSAESIILDARNNFKSTNTRPGRIYAKELLRIYNSGKLEKNRLPDILDTVVLNKKSKKYIDNTTDNENINTYKEQKDATATMSAESSEDKSYIC